MNRKMLWLLFVAAYSLAASTAFAQYDQVYPGFNTPFTDMPIEDYDFQWFAPPITEVYGQDGIDPKTGPFFDYHRVYLNVTRGEAAPDNAQGDVTWGNKLDMGWMSEEGHGWLLRTLHIDGPQVAERNVGSTISVGLNKVWRLDPYHNGFWVEPMIGVRYFQFKDQSLRVTYDYFPIINTWIIDDTHLAMENNMLLGQVGVRMHTHRGHWKLYGEWEVFGGNNWVYRMQQDNTYSKGIMGTEITLGCAYYLTREIALDFSWNTIYFPDGVGRNPYQSSGNQSESLFISGLGFGFSFHR
ncbi:hypothetical protein LOC68_26590 [Blastopirellula sp. JC732]|uniref:Outer membrane protein beta-barrel domain-containing protein n=1 Tax=Blastopirellula sediminis TaxID=2894196 RepID=A0A9X1MT25_9BACT|nr:hypothetical protein [Blastopirellula sediminis]MCC9604721.1 hypothetical protein [Blastopirellula sediminis]MCC9631980.1 hypothetical protein [Blastopirellula sediminis]